MVEKVQTKSQEFDVERHASECPICHHKIVPEVRDAITMRKSFPTAQVVYRCTNIDCLRLFIGLFSGPFQPYPRFSDSYYQLRAVTPNYPQTEEFPKSIQAVSPRFVEIYNQAYSAEQDKLDQICGPGYRKALEFLIKDYLIKNNPEKEAAVKAAQLANCIANFVANDNIKKVASRAAWLGNDETHFERKWIDKDIEYLKNLVTLTVQWIDMEELTAQAVQDMPEPERSSRPKTS